MLNIEITEYTKFFIAMIAIVDPLAILPFYAQITRTLTAEHKVKLARQAALATTIALITSLYLGEHILNFFGISLGSFKIAGGIILMIMALELMWDRSGGKEHIETNVHFAGSQIVVPLAIPLLAGPGAFSTVIVYSLRGTGWEHYALITTCLIIIGLIIWISLHMAGKILQRVGGTAIAIINRVMGLIMAAIAVEFIANGIRQLITGS